MLAFVIEGKCKHVFRSDHTIQLLWMLSTCNLETQTKFNAKTFMSILVIIKFDQVDTSANIYFAILLGYIFIAKNFWKTCHEHQRFLGLKAKYVWCQKICHADRAYFLIKSSGRLNDTWIVLFIVWHFFRLYSEIA